MKRYRVVCTNDDGTKVTWFFTKKRALTYAENQKEDCEYVRVDKKTETIFYYYEDRSSKFRCKGVNKK